MVDLSTCKKGDMLISSHGAILEYISPTPWGSYKYLDHVVKYPSDEFGDENYGTRTNDGFVYAKNRKPEIDHDIVEIVRKSPIINILTDYLRNNLEVDIRKDSSVSRLNYSTFDVVVKLKNEEISIKEFEVEHS